MCMGGSLCCPPQSITALLIGSAPVTKSNAFCLLKIDQSELRWYGPSSLLLSQLSLQMGHPETAAQVRHTNGHGASNPGAPCSPFSPLGPFLPFFPFSPCGYKGLNKRQFLFGVGGSNGDSKDGLANESLEGHLPPFSGFDKA